jgi:predicted DNA-binding protein
MLRSRPPSWLMSVEAVRRCRKGQRQKAAAGGEAEVEQLQQHALQR